GAFKTLTLRNVELTGPYMHDGVFATLDQVVAFYVGGGGPSPNKDPLIRPLDLDTKEQKALVAFLRSLTDPTARLTPSYLLCSIGSSYQCILMTNLLVQCGAWKAPTHIRCNTSGPDRCPRPRRRGRRGPGACSSPSIGGCPRRRRASRRRPAWSRRPCPTRA